MQNQDNTNSTSTLTSPTLDKAEESKEPSKNKEETKKEYIIVTSVKGGCGKSSVSLRTAIELIQQNDNHNVLIIDMDILGTCLEEFVDGNVKANAQSVGSTYPGYLENATYLQLDESSEQNHYFTDLFIKDYDTQKDLIKWRDYNVTINNTKKNNKLHIAFSSPDQAVKNMFQPKNAGGYRSIVNIRYYKEVLKNYVQTLDKIAGYKFTHVIFDMPPNSDPYSECIYDILQKEIKEDKAKLELRIVSSCDIAHIQANLNWTKDYIKTTAYNNQFPHTIKFIVNDVNNFQALKGIGIEADKVAHIKELIQKTFQNGILKIYPSIAYSSFIAQKAIWYNYDYKLTFSAAADLFFTFTTLNKPNDFDLYT